MKMAVIMIHYGQISTTRASLKELREKIGDHQLILINNTPDDLSTLANIIPRTKVIDNSKNVGFAKAVNQGIKKASSLKGLDGYLLMNNDLSLSFGSLDRLAKTFIDKPSAGIVSPVLHHGSKLYDWGGKYNRWTGMVRHRNFAQRPKTILSVGHVAGAAVLIKKAVVEKIGLFDERFFLYYEDLDYCLRAQKAGFTIHINPEIVAEHAVSAGSNALGRTLHQWRSHFKFVLKHIPGVAYLTAFLIDIVFYPLILIKVIIQASLSKRK